MLFENYKDNIVYSSQSKINFPKSGTSSEKMGTGSAIFLLCPNREKAVEVISDDRMGFRVSLTKRFMTDSIYKEKIGTKRVTSLERSATDKFFLSQKDFPLVYVPSVNKNTVLSRKLNVVYDLSRWMEIIFSRSDKMAAKRKCSEFIRILSNKLSDSSFKDYDKLLLFDLNSWTSTIKECVVMNKRLLNNPLSILFYSACYYPSLLDNLPNTRLMIVNRASGQIFLIHLKDITKKSYPKIKSKLNRFRSLVFSVEDEVESETINDESVESEVKAEVINSFKEDIKQQLRNNLLGENKNVFDEIEDITSETADPFDEFEDELNQNDEDDSDSTEVESTPEKDDLLSELNLDDDISKEVDAAFDDIDDIDVINPDELVDSLSAKIKKNKYQASFMPVRDEKQLANIARLTADQEKVLPKPTISDVKRKSLTTVDTGTYVNTTNPNIVSSKFASFDKDYTTKCLPKNIDDSVAILSKASDKIFVTSKEITDSSTPMDLKETYTYKLVDEKGNKMTISFDVPKVLDGTYVYLNGTKKNIRHQLILKPIVKTSADTVQLVTAYGKVFIRRKGAVNQNVNRIDTYLEKNMDKFKAKVGNCSMKNEKYIVPLDFSMLSRYFSEFTIGPVTFYLAIDVLKEKYKKMTGNDLVYDEANELPVGLNRRKKEVILLNLSDSYTDLIYSYFPEEDQAKISNIKRKPKYVHAQAKLLGRNIPLILFMLFCEGFSSVMKKANIEYEFILDNKAKRNYDSMEYDSIDLLDGVIMWKKKPFRNELLMNGLKNCDLSDFEFSELESKDTYISLLMAFCPGNIKVHNELDNYKDFLLDEKSKEILTDFGYPTDLISLLVVAAGMLSDANYLIENNMNNLRVRSTEVIADIIYKNITKAYKQYRATSYKDKPTKISIKKSQIIDDLLSSDTNMIEESSVLNPVLELEKNRSVTFKGTGGIQLDRAMTLPRRAYDKSMLGTIGLTTSPKIFDWGVIW